jgi:hypothetical protein
VNCVEVKFANAMEDPGKATSSSDRSCERNEDRAVLDLATLTRQVQELARETERLKKHASSGPQILPNSSFLEPSADGVPKGWRIYNNPSGRFNVQVTTEHKWFHGFVGAYTDTRPADAAPTPAEATEAHPFWYGRYDCGPRIPREGWGPVDYRILRIRIKQVGQEPGHVGLFTDAALPFIHGRTDRDPTFRVRAWVKVFVGALGFSQDVAANQLIVDASDNQNKDAQGWVRVDGEITSCFGTAGAYIGFGRPYNSQHPIVEALVVLPYISVIDPLWMECPRRT